MTGIGNYARNLLRAVAKGRRPIGILLPEGSPFAGDFPGSSVHFTHMELTSHPWTELYEQFFIPRFCRRHGYDDFVSFEGRVPLWKGRLRTYPFIYDLAYRKVSGTHGLKYEALLRLSHWIACRSADRIITISEAVKHDLVKDLRLSARRLLVVHPSDSGLSGHDPAPVANVRKPYLLATSITNSRKNLGRLLTAFRFLRERNSNLQLVLTGRPELIAKHVGASDDPGIVNAGFAGEGQLRHLYENASVFVYPSLEEGFGIPLLDAALAGCPVACSNIPVFHEVLGDDAEYFDPLDPSSIATAMTRLLESPRRPDPSRIGTRFSWERSAELLLDALDEGS